EAHRRTPDPPTARLGSRPQPAPANTPRGGGRLPLRPKRAAFQAAQASAPDALLPDNPRSSTYSPGLLLLRPLVYFCSALDKYKRPSKEVSHGHLLATLLRKVLPDSRRN